MDSNIDNLNLLSARASQTKASAGEKQSDNYGHNASNHHVHEVMLTTPEDYESRRGEIQDSPKNDEDDSNSQEYQKLAGIKLANQQHFKLNMREILG